MQKNGESAERISKPLGGFVRAGLFTIVAFLIIISPCAAHAASLYFDPGGVTAGTDGIFKVGLLIDAKKPVNAFDIKLRIPVGLNVVDASDGNSIINLWIERPSFDQSTRILSFSGIVPGGFSGRGGRLAVLSLAADEPGSFNVALDLASVIMLNGAVPTADTIESAALPVIVEAGKQNLGNIIPDYDPPEEFIPSVATSSEIFNGRYALYFEAQDKGSGIQSYLEADSPFFTKDYRSLTWRDARSPYLIDDQSLSSYIYVKAVDKAGNERVESLPPVNPGSWPRSSGWAIIITIALILAIAWLFFIKKFKHVKH